MVKVSLIVAVYNPGANLDELLTSIDEQSLPPEEFEVIFADDDSSDGSRERLIEWATTRKHIWVVHNTPNSGWPGRPRNLGIDAAAGEFLFFADNDDRLAPRALEWMYDFATQTGADVVIPKLVGVGPGRVVPRQLFRKNIVDAKLGKDPILAILTPHKLVRTAMVREHGIRFPEGRVRLEDHFFIVSCYFAARRIAVLADKLCYYWMRRVAEGENASFAPIDPVVYYRSVERILEIVEAKTESGPLRDKLYAHWYDGKMLARIRGGSLLSKPPEYQESLVREVRRVSDRFGLGEAQWPWLGAGARMRSHLIEHGTLEEVRILGTAERGVTSRIELDEVAWTDDDRLRLRLCATMVYADGNPVRLDRHDDAVYWDTTDLVPTLDLPQVDITDLARRVRLDVLLADRHTLAVEFAPGLSECIDGDGLTAHAEVTLEPLSLVAGDQARTIVDLRARLAGAGWGSERRIFVDDTSVLPESRVVGGVRVLPYATNGHSNLSIALHPPEAEDPHVPEAGVTASVWPADLPRPGLRSMATRFKHWVKRRLPPPVKRLLRRGRS